MTNAERIAFLAGFDAHITKKSEVITKDGVVIGMTEPEWAFTDHFKDGMSSRALNAWDKQRPRVNDRPFSGEMTVEDLIARLQAFPATSRVMILDSFNGAGFPRTINSGPREHVVTQDEADETADCEEIVGETVVVMGFGSY